MTPENREMVHHKTETGGAPDSEGWNSAEESRRSGRYLAFGLVFVLVFIACYQILMRKIPVLVGLLAPAVIMILYLIWLLYFAKKKTQETFV